MKAIFLDIDGVLNTAAYRRQKGLDYFSDMIDRDHLRHLKRIADATGAQIILSSSWRLYWNENARQTDSVGQYIQRTLSDAGLPIRGKTPVLEAATRSEEIRLWLKSRPYIESYVILDDQDHLWHPSLRRHFVQTSDAGEGLNAELAALAIEVLGGKLLPLPKGSLGSRLFHIFKGGFR